jgi:hypothetical protein
MRLDLSSLGQFFDSAQWPLIVECRQCFPEVDGAICGDVAVFRAWAEAHADLPHEGDDIELLLIPFVREIPPKFFGPDIGTSL